MARDREKESYTHVVILLLMRCVRPVLRALVEDLVRKETPRGENTWSIDEFLACHKRRIEKELPVIDKYNVYKNILYPTNTENPKTDTNKWDLTLFVFILTKACKIEQELAYYTGQITSIREDFCKARFPGITRSMCKDYRKRLSRVRSRLHKELRDDDLKKKIESRAKRIEARNTSSSEKEEILKQWKDIEVVQRLKGAATKTGVQKYLTIKMLLSKSCCGVMQALVFNSVRNNRPIRTTRWSLDCFLQRHKSRIGRRIWSLDKLGRPMEVLFPKGRTTQIDEWDISLLCWVLLNVCFLEEDIADSIGEMRTIRNEIAHNSSLSLSDLAYNSYLERIKSSIDTCLSFINDEELSESINDQVEDIEQTSVDKDETIRRLQESYRSDISEKEQQEKHLEVQQNILSELSRIVKKFKDIEIPECELELVINNCNQENENTMSKAIVEEINEKLEPEQGHSSSGRNQNFRAAVKTMLRETKSKGWSLTKATKGSVLLNVRCGSFDDLCQLYDTYRGNGSDLHFVDLRSALHCTMGVDVKLHLVMYDIEMNKCVEKIVTAVMEATKRMTSRTANEIKKEYEPSSPSWDDCTSEGERRLNLDNRLLKIREAVTSQYYVSDQTPLAMTEEWNQHTSDDVDMAARDKAEYEQQLSCPDNPDDRSPYLEMEYTVSDTSGMEVEYQDVKQAVKETDLAINKTDTKYDLKIEEPVTGSPGISFVYGPKTLEEEFKREMVTFLLGTEYVLIEDICGNTYFDSCYVEPPLINLCPEEEIYYFNEKTISDRGNRIESLKDVFFHHSVPFKDIYLTAEAGIGKTAFTKRLSMMWCMAHGCYETQQKLKKERIQENALETMKKFEFLFCIPLREAGFAVCEMESLVYDHVVKRLSNPYMFPKEFISILLQRENTLVILDGLDEWSHPKSCEKQGDVPHRNETSHCTILTTTRPWKLSALRLHDTIIDKVVKISKLDEGASRRLACNLISTWNSKGKCSKLKTYEDFEEKLSLENVGDVKLVPYLLVQLIRLWYNGKRMGRSMCEILGNILALKTGFHTLKPFDDGYEHRGFAVVGKKLPAKSICVTAYPCDLTILGKLAFDGLYCHQNNTVLVFEQGVVDEAKLSRYIEMDILCMTNEKRISFQHKILQEYLAALYIQSQENEHTIEKMAQFCTSVTSVLDQKNVIMFLAYLDPNVVNTIWQTLQPTISNSAIVLKYRNRLIMSREDIWNLELVEKVQEMIVSTLIITELALPIEDIIIEDNRNIAYFSALKRILDSHGDSVRSIRVKGIPSRTDLLPLLKLLTTLRGLQKLSMAGIDYVYLVPHVMLLSADTLSSVSLESDHICERTGHFESISSEILQILVQLQKLQSLSLRHWQFTDEKLRYFYRVLKAQTDMKQLMLEGLACQNCDGFELDLFQDQLQGITICNVPVTKLHADLSSLEYCCLGGLPPGVEASILAMLKGATNLQTLYLTSISPNCMTSDGQGNTLADILLISKRFKRLSFIILDFDGINLDKQTCNDLTNFIEKIQETRRQVTVILKISNSVGHCCCDSFRSFPVFLQKVRVSCNSDCRLAICKSKGLLG